MENLEVFFGAQKLIIIFCSLSALIENFFFLVGDDLLQLLLLVHHEIEVHLCLVKLSLKPRNAGTAVVLVALRLHCVALESLIALLDSFLLMLHALDLIVLVSLLLRCLDQLLLQLAHSLLVVVELGVKTALIVIQLVHGR
jgi:hypothetical protein